MMMTLAGSSKRWLEGQPAVAAAVHFIPVALILFTLFNKS